MKTFSVRVGSLANEVDYVVYQDDQQNVTAIAQEAESSVFQPMITLGVYDDISIESVRKQIMDRLIDLDTAQGGGSAVGNG